MLVSAGIALDIGLLVIEEMSALLLASMLVSAAAALKICRLTIEEIYVPLPTLILISGAVALEIGPLTVENVSELCLPQCSYSLLQLWKLIHLLSRR